MEEEVQVEEEKQNLTPGKYKFSVAVGHGADNKVEKQTYKPYPE